MHWGLSAASIAVRRTSSRVVHQGPCWCGAVVPNFELKASCFPEGVHCMTLLGVDVIFMLLFVTSSITHTVDAGCI
jgi:hypothetical protein